MRAGLIAMLVFIWICGGILGATLEQSQLGAGEEGVLNQIMVWNQVSSTQSWGVLNIITQAPQFFSGVFSMLTFNFSFLGGSVAGGYFSWLVLTPLRAVIIFGMIMMFVLIFMGALK